MINFATPDFYSAWPYNMNAARAAALGTTEYPFDQGYPVIYDGGPVTGGLLYHEMPGSELLSIDPSVEPEAYEFLWRTARAAAATSGLVHRACVPRAIVDTVRNHVVFPPYPSASAVADVRPPAGGIVDLSVYLRPAPDVLPDLVAECPHSAAAAAYLAERFRAEGLVPDTIGLRLNGNERRHRTDPSLGAGHKWLEYADAPNLPERFRMLGTVLVDPARNLCNTVWGALRQPTTTWRYLERADEEAVAIVVAAQREPGSKGYELIAAYGDLYSGLGEMAVAS